MDKLPDKQHAVMEAWGLRKSIYGYFAVLTFYSIACAVYETENPDEKQIRRVRKIARCLARKEYLKHQYFFNDFSGMIGGSGYMPTLQQGINYIKEHVVER